MKRSESGGRKAKVLLQCVSEGFTNLWVRLVIYCCACMTTSCLYFGWQDYSKMLMKSGAYGWQCSPQDKLDTLGFCESQRKTVAQLYPYANGSEFACAAVAGLLLDWIGPRYTAFLGESLQLCAVLMLCFSSQSVPMYVPAIFLTGASVNIICFPALTVMENWPSHQALTVSLIVGCQSAASLVSPILFKIWEAHPSWNFTSLWGRWVLALWLPVTVLYIISLPRRRNFAALLTTDTPEIEQSPVKTEILARCETNSTKNLNDSQLSAALPPRGDRALWRAFGRDLLTFNMLLMCLYFSLQMFQFAYYPTVVREAVSESISDFVGWMTPLQFPFSVIIGFLLDYTGTVFVMYGMCATLVFVYLSVAFGSAHTGLMRFVAIWFVFMQAATYNVKYTFVNEMYDPFNFGKLVGFIGVCGGIGVYLSAPLTSSYQYRLVMCLLTGLAAVMALLTTILFLRQRTGKTHKTIPGVTQTARLGNRSFGSLEKAQVTMDDEV